MHIGAPLSGPYEKVPAWRIDLLGQEPVSKTWRWKYEEKKGRDEESTQAPRS